MGIHADQISQIKEAIEEKLLIAKLAIDLKKPSGGGCHGYPAALLLFSIIDTIGSFHRGSENFSVTFSDGETTRIGAEGRHHFYVLSSKFFECSLTRKEAEIIYDNYRNVLDHNSTLPSFRLLSNAAGNAQPFEFKPGHSIIYLPALYAKTEGAVKLFLSTIHEVADSLALKAILKKGEWTDRPVPLESLQVVAASGVFYPAAVSGSFLDASAFPEVGTF